MYDLDPKVKVIGKKARICDGVSSTAALVFFIVYAFKGQVHVFAGRVKIVNHSSCRTSAILKYFCPLQKSNFQDMIILHIKLKGITKCSNMVANILHADTPLPTTLGNGIKGQNLTFSEHGHVAYQIKGNHMCSNMVANILPADPPPPHRPWGWGQ